MLLLDERILSDGTHAKTFARVSGDSVALRDDDGTDGELSITALDRVMVRFGKPLESGIELSGEHLELPGGYRLRRLRFHAVVDATGRDYLVWERPNEEPVCAVATTVTAALKHLIRASKN